MKRVFRHNKEPEIDWIAVLNHAIRMAGSVGKLAETVGYSVETIRTMKKQAVISKPLRTKIKAFITRGTHEEQ